MKKFKLRFDILFILFFGIETSVSQHAFSIFENKIYHKNIHTPLLYQEGNPLSYPIIHLNSEEKLTLSFDDFNAEVKDYYYTLIHCNPNWTKSDLMQSEYINGFFNNKIEDYEFSFNTLQKYTHYNLVFPQNYLTPILSGNYIIKVFTNNNPEEIVLIKRFMILDEKVNIISNVKRATLIDDREYKQEIDFIINHPNLYISNPYKDIQVIVKQNNRIDNSIDSLAPIFIKKDQLIYDYQDENTFFGNNEFRHFDIKSIRYYSDRIKTIKHYNVQFDTIKEKIVSDSNNIIIVQLYTDVSRSFNEYITVPDLNGGFLIEKQEAWDSEIEAEYVNVNFSLLENRKISYGDIYLIGRFTDWNLSPEYKLIFNQESRRYEVSALLKQGYYNYLYVLRDNTNNTTNTSFIEGSHYECQNEYYIYVYYRDIGQFYDQLVGYIKISSNSLF